MQLEDKIALMQQLKQERYPGDRQEGSSFRGRFLLAVLLFLFFFYMDIHQLSIGTVTTEQIFDFLEENSPILELSVPELS